MYFPEPVALPRLQVHLPRTAPTANVVEVLFGELHTGRPPFLGSEGLCNGLVEYLGLQNQPVFLVPVLSQRHNIRQRLFAHRQRLFAHGQLFAHDDPSFPFDWE